MQVAPYKINNSRFPVILVEPMLVKVTQTTAPGWKDILLPDTNALKGHRIIGAFIVKQNDAAATKKKLEPSTGLPLLAIGAVQNAYLNIQDSCGTALQNFPLETLLVDGCLAGGFHYTKLVFPDGIKCTKSFIKIETSCLESAEEVLVIHWLLGNRECCVIAS